MMKVKDCMTSDCKFVSKDMTLQEAAQIMRDLDIGFLPVAEQDRLVGMVTDRDMVVRCLAEGCDPTTEVVRNAMTEKTFYCYDDQTIEDIAKNMGEIQVRRLPVVNRQKRLVGVLSLGDIAQQAANDRVGRAEQEITGSAAA